MRKLCLCILACLFCSLSYGGELEKIEFLSAKAILQNTNGYFVLADGSCFKVIGFQKRWRSLSEWWNNVQLVPENYECVPGDWHLGTEVEIWSKHGIQDLHITDASNQEDLKQCTHFLANRRTGQILFAIALHPADCLVQAFADAHKEGYDSGYTQGRSKGLQTGTEIYNSGYQDGYEAALRGE